MSLVYGEKSRMKFVTLLAIATLALSFGFVPAQTVSKDAVALLEFKKGIQKDPLGHVLNSWNEESVDGDGCPSSWHGIVCKNGMVTGIDLSNLNLSGEIQLRILNNLKTLQNINLFNNSLTGKLSNLTVHSVY